MIDTSYRGGKQGWEVKIADLIHALVRYHHRQLRMKGALPFEDVAREIEEEIVKVIKEELQKPSKPEPSR